MTTAYEVKTSHKSDDQDIRVQINVAWSEGVSEEDLTRFVLRAFAEAGRDIGKEVKGEPSS